VDFLDERRDCHEAVGQTPLGLSGFASNPGQSWLTSVTLFSYSSDGSVLWEWPTGFGFVAVPAGTNVSCTIVHQ